MLRIALAATAIILMIVPGLGRAQDENKPTIAVLQMGENAIALFAASGIINTLQAYGYITAEEMSAPQAGIGLPGEIAEPRLANLNFHHFNADFDLSAMQLLVDAALDIEPDIIVAIEETAALSAVNATATLDDPPVVLFAAVPDPYTAGIAQASCVKPAHVSGAHSILPYEDILPMVLAQQEDLNTIGVVFNSNESSSGGAAKEIARVGESLGWRVELAGAIGFADMAPATGGLLARGAQAIFLPNSSMLAASQPIVTTVAGEAGVPVYTIGMEGSLYPQGSMIGVSFNQWYDQGNNLGRIAVAWLNGEIDIAEAGISAETPLLGYTVNQNFADQWGIELDADLVEAADILLAGSGMDLRSDRVRAEFGKAFMPLPLEARQAGDQAFIESIRCTPEMVEEQQAELDAASD